ncbi:hypothetical protein [Fulvivirga lutea]|uniref:Uncharacterized protein n=1 Tax=Fulvivirga lutea TaxID=2810512 RepID=A0A974WI91_9BACT|nr:hypothetical protein [Fulvivirga lutea]QSE98640.1 hypothetical protein JR347_06060 [Fulvivirga lutea]
MKKIIKSYNDAHIIYNSDSEIFSTLMNESLNKLENNAISDYQYGFLQAGLDILQQEGGITHEQNQKIRLKSYNLNVQAKMDLVEFLENSREGQTDLSVINFETVNREILSKEFPKADRVKGLNSDKERNTDNQLGH